MGERARESEREERLLYSMRPKQQRTKQVSHNEQEGITKVLNHVVDFKREAMTKAE